MRIAIALVAALSAGSAYAECDYGKDGALELSKWGVTPAENQEDTLTYAVTNTGERAMRMVEATVVFTDDLGREVARLPVGSDAAFAQGGTVVQEWPGFSRSLLVHRLADVDPDLVSAEVCISSVVYEDGTVEEFG